MTGKRKKSKYQHIEINKKKYYFCKITWEDILGDAGHADSEEMLKMKPAVMISHGYLFHKDKNKLITFASYDTTQESFSDRNVFPIGCIKKIEKLNIQ